MSIDSALEKQNLYKLHLWRAPAVCLPSIIHGSGHFRSCWYLVLCDWSAGGSNINTSILNMHQCSPHMRVLCLWWIDDCVCGQTAEVLCQASRGQSSCSCIRTQAQLHSHQTSWDHVTSWVRPCRKTAESQETHTVVQCKTLKEIKTCVLFD